MKAVRRVLSMVTLAAITATATPSPAAPTLRVLTFNAWGLWMVSPSREARVEAMGTAIAALEPDVVALQEVWLDEDAARIQADLEQAGLPYARRFRSTWPGHSGLLLVSRHPIAETTFQEYEPGTRPFIPWHVDWAGGKGIARIRIETPSGPVDVANTHLQASYGTDDYEMVQLAQILQAADFLDRPSETPLVVAGDLNVPCASLTYRTFAQRLGLRPTDPECGIDSISTRDGVQAGLQVLDVQQVLTEDRPLSDGTVQPLSDHPGVLVTFGLTAPTVRPAVGVPPAARPSWLSLVREALPKVHLAKQELAHAQMQNGVLAGALILVGLLGGWFRRRWRPRLLWRSMATAGLLSGLWCAYLGLSYAPDGLHSLDVVVKRLHAPLRAAMAGAREPIDLPAELADSGP